MAKRMVRAAAMLENEEIQLLQALAKRNDRSVAAEIRIAIRKHLGLVREQAA